MCKMFKKVNPPIDINTPIATNTPQIIIKPDYGLYFEESLDFVLKAEGGYVDNPLDKGSPTNKGITQNVYDNFRVNRTLPSPTRSVLYIDNLEVQEIYNKEY